MTVYNPKVLYKFGTTSKIDATERFAAISDRYDIRILFSCWLPAINADQHEQNFLERFPKNVYVTETFKGITEIRSFDDKTKSGILAELYSLKRKWSEMYKGKKGDRKKFYFAELTLKS